MPDNKKTTVQVMDMSGRIEKLWVTALDFKAHGVWCEEGQGSHRFYIPYTSIRLITKPKETK